MILSLVWQWRGDAVGHKICRLEKKVAVLEAQRVEDQKAVALVAAGFKLLLLLLLGIAGLVLRGR